MIALGSDIDGIPQASQKPGVAYHDPIIAGAPGHGEGHNSGQAVNITAALAVKKIMEREKLPGTIKLWPGVAEELRRHQGVLRARRLLQGRRRRAVHARRQQPRHVVGRRERATAWSRSSTRSAARARTAPARPWRGRSALDAVELMNIGWNFRREHLRLQQRSHYVITDGGDQPNVVPPTASVWYYFRETDYPRIKELWEIGNTMAEGAALMTGTEVESRGPRLGVAAALQQGRSPRRCTANIKKVGLPQWSDADQTLAKALQTRARRCRTRAWRSSSTKLGRSR